MERIHDNNYIIDISNTNCLVNTTSNSEQFGFSGYNIDCFINCLDNRFVI